MKKHTAAQKRLFQNATMIVATRLLFSALAEKYAPQVLNDVITIFNGQSLKKSERQDDGLFEVYGSGGLVGTYSEYLSEKPFVVIGRKGSAGKPTYAPFGGWVIDTAYYAQPNDENALDTKYLYFGLSSIDFSDDIITTAIPGINRTAIYKHTLPVPPLDIQIAVNEFLEAAANKTALPELPDFLNHIPAIIARVESLAARVNEAQRLREEAIIETSALLLSGYHQVFQPKADWVTAKVGDFCDNPQYGYTESAKADPVGVKYLRITDIQDGKVNWNSVPYCECPEPEKYLLKQSDIVFARTGATTGKSFLIKECPKSVFASYLIRLRVQHTVTPEYLYAFFQSPDYWQQITDEKKGTGQPNVNGQKLINIRVPVPPLDEQRRIVAYLDGLQAKVNALRELQSASGEELSALMPSVLDKAFKGEL